jgi:dTDP-4-amino-4,6-dideoxygalactose transaminase
MQATPSRRGFLGALSTATAALGFGSTAAASAAATPAILGGKPVRSTKFSHWPIVDNNDEAALLRVLKSGRWNRLKEPGSIVEFEEKWASTLGAKHCLAVSNGTSALIASLAALGVGPGDEVIVPPYTFVATINAVLMHHALPVFVDTNPDTFQIDARQVEAAITDKTACIMPVHLGGNAADLDTILAAAAKHNVPVIEDACQAHLSEWKGKKVSTLGTVGCFSFQASKNLNSGEGGAIVTNNTDLYEQCKSFHTNGRSADSATSYIRHGANLRITEFQAALLLTQLTRLEEQSRRRDQNAAYLTKLLSEIPGITPAKLHDGCTRSSFHLFMFRYDKVHFAGLPRAKFQKALGAEGISTSAGYSPLYKEPFLKNTLQSRGYQAIYSSNRLNDYFDKLHFPANDRLCTEAVWFIQTMLLGPRSDMDQIAEAIRKIQSHAAQIAKV